jgi:hypothetical protein
MSSSDKPQPSARHLPDQVAASSRECLLAHQRSGGLGRDVRVVGIYGVQSQIRAEPAQLIEQGGGSPLQSEWSHPEDPEASIIHPFSIFHKFFVLTCL